QGVASGTRPGGARSLWTPVLIVPTPGRRVGTTAPDLRPCGAGFRDRATDSANPKPISPSDTLPKNLASCSALLARESPNLALVTSRWPALPRAVRAGILALVRAGADGAG